MEILQVLAFLFMLAWAVVIAYYSGEGTGKALDYLTQGYVDPESEHWFCKFAGFFIGVYGYMLAAVLGGPHGYLWGLLVAALAFPVFAGVIVGCVRLREAICDRFSFCSS